MVNDEDVAEAHRRLGKDFSTLADHPGLMSLHDVAGFTLNASRRKRFSAVAEETIAWAATRPSVDSATLDRLRSTSVLLPRAPSAALGLSLAAAGVQGPMRSSSSAEAAMLGIGGVTPPQRTRRLSRAAMSPSTSQISGGYGAPAYGKTPPLSPESVRSAASAMAAAYSVGDRDAIRKLDLEFAAAGGGGGGPDTAEGVGVHAGNKAAQPLARGGQESEEEEEAAARPVETVNGGKKKSKKKKKAKKKKGKKTKGERSAEGNGTRASSRSPASDARREQWVKAGHMPGSQRRPSRVVPRRSEF